MQIKWTRIEQALWQGQPDVAPPELAVQIALSNIVAEPIFISQVTWLGHVVHRSERECLCAAKQEASAAVIRTITLRGTAS